MRKYKKVICPECGSEDLFFYREFVITKYYQLNKKNEPTRKVFQKSKPDCSNMPYNWTCNNCDCIFGGTYYIRCKYKEVEDE